MIERAYLSEPDMCGLYLANSTANYGAWVPVVVYDCQHSGDRMVRKNDEINSSPLSSWLSEKWDMWWGPIERPNAGLSPSERQVLEEYQSVIEWLEARGVPSRVHFDDRMWRTTAMYPTRLRDAVLAEIRKEAK